MKTLSKKQEGIFKRIYRSKYYNRQIDCAHIRYLSKNTRTILMKYINYQCEHNLGYTFELPCIPLLSDDTQESWETRNNAHICISVYGALYTAVEYQLTRVPAFITSPDDYVFYIDHDNYDNYYNQVHAWLEQEEEYELLSDFATLKVKLHELSSLTGMD